jgi:hypothetical protein
VKETLTRMGVASNKDKVLYQSAHILHKRGEYAILHFKEMFIMDNRPSDIDEEDIHRRNKIAKLLIDWGLVQPINDTQIPFGDISLKVLPHKEKDHWTLKPKYRIGIRT